MVPKILRRSSVEELIGLSLSSIYAMMANNEFPKPLELGLFKTASGGRLFVNNSTYPRFK